MAMRNDMVQTFSAERADQTFYASTLPRRPRSTKNFFVGPHYCLEGLHDDTAIASKTISFADGRRFVGLLTDLFPNLQTELGGSIHISASQPIYALENLWKHERDE
jgi:hypothetical protein